MAVDPVTERGERGAGGRRAGWRGRCICFGMIRLIAKLCWYALLGSVAGFLLSAMLELSAVLLVAGLYACFRFPFLAVSGKPGAPSPGDA